MLEPLGARENERDTDRGRPTGKRARTRLMDGWKAVRTRERTSLPSHGPDPAAGWGACPSSRPMDDERGGGGGGRDDDDDDDGIISYNTRTYPPHR